MIPSQRRLEEPNLAAEEFQMYYCFSFLKENLRSLFYTQRDAVRAKRIVL